jgi:arginase
VASIGVIDVPSDSAGISGGVAKAPAALRNAGLMEALCQVALVEDLGDVPLPEPVPGRDPVTGLIDPGMFAAVVEGVADLVAAALGRGLFPLVIGGDCSLLLGCVRGAAAAGVLFVDGHEDAYLPHQSPTGEVADLELSYLLGRADPPEGMALTTLPPSAIAILGARDTHLLRDEGVASLRTEVSFADDSEVRVDPELMTARALAAIPRPFWFHVDLDVVSTEAMGSVDYRQDGGIGWTDLGSVAREAMVAGPSGMDVTIFNPDLDDEGQDARRIVRFLVDVVRMMA